MASPPPPASPCARVRLIYQDSGGNQSGNRFYVSYAAGPPSGANCSALATSIAGLWNTDIAPIVNDDVSLIEVDVLDIATTLGASGTVSVSHAGTRAGTPLPIQCATNVEIDIAQRYRGGKPRLYWPPPVTGDQIDPSRFNSTFIALANTQTAAFFTAVNALAPTGFGTIAHVVLSFYEGKNTTTPPWRGPGYKYPPKYRSPSALLYAVEGYACKAVIGSQKRRRTATTP